MHKLTNDEQYLLDHYCYVFEQGGNINDFVKAAKKDKAVMTAPVDILHIIQWFDFDTDLNPLNEINRETVDYIEDNDLVIITSKKVINNPVTTRLFTVAGDNLEEVHFPEVTAIYKDDGYLIDDAPELRLIDLPNLQRVFDRDFYLFMYNNEIYNFKELITTEAAAKQLTGIKHNTLIKDKIKIV